MRTLLWPKFPAYQGIYREFGPKMPFQTFSWRSKYLIKRNFFQEFPTQRNREIFRASRECCDDIREPDSTNRDAHRKRRMDARFVLEDGRQPADLSAQRLLNSLPSPLRWMEQLKAF
jgi:hypothetical protein